VKKMPEINNNAGAQKAQSGQGAPSIGCTIRRDAVTSTLRVTEYFEGDFILKGHMVVENNMVVRGSVKCEKGLHSLVVNGYLRANKIKVLDLVASTVVAETINTRRAHAQEIYTKDMLSTGDVWVLGLHAQTARMRDVRANKVEAEKLQTRSIRCPSIVCPAVTKLPEKKTHRQ
jgi:cytoskeletal protein CcmA (bactofilin family)